MTKKTKQNIFIGFAFVITVGLLILSIYYNHDINGIDLIFWCCLAIIAETFLIYNPDGISTSAAPTVYIYVGLVSNPLVVLIIIIVGSLLKFPVYEDGRKTLFQTKISTTLFNMCNMALSMGSSAWILSMFNKTDHILYVIINVIAALLVAQTVNYVMISTLLYITKDVHPNNILQRMGKGVKQMVILGTAGVLLAIAHRFYGREVVFLLFVPVLLARYSFKFYFESQKMALDTVHALNEALHAKDAYTGGHTGRVEQYAVELALAYGLSSSECEIIRAAALLHDIGKIGIPDIILNKPGRLTHNEYEQIQEHPCIGAKILGNVNSLKYISQIIMQHHERYDGTGYPDHLKGSQIFIEAAILMIADSYDAMTTDRPYRKALDKDEAIDELIKCSGTQFHPMLAKCFIESVLSTNRKIVEFEEKAILKKTKQIVDIAAKLPKDLTE